MFHAWPIPTPHRILPGGPSPPLIASYQVAQLDQEVARDAEQYHIRKAGGLVNGPALAEGHRVRFADSNMLESVHFIPNCDDIKRITAGEG